MTETIASYVLTMPPKNWEHIFKQCTPEIEHASACVENEKLNGHICVPLFYEVFNVFNFISPEKVRVVIFGQDPYYTLIPNTNIPIAHGLSFSVRKGTAVPVSLRNIFKEIKRIYPTCVFNSGELTQWVNQGVLMLNACLTVNLGYPGSHKSIWGPFIKKIIAYLCEVNPKIIFVLWGNEAQKLAENLNIEGKIQLKGPHPAARGAAFSGCNHFVEINNILESRGEPKIDWSIYEEI
jgi:uracil-DNA glycosylase